MQNQELGVVRECDPLVETTRPQYAPADSVPFRAAAEDFGDAYIDPEHRCKLLRRLNLVPGRDLITFLEKPHLYLCDGRVATASVSGMIKPYAEDFDGKGCIKKMQNSRREAWPRLKYAVSPVPANITELDGSSCILIVDAGGKTTFAGHLGDAPPCKEGDVVYTYERAMTEAEILASWDTPDARNRGTEAHLSLENWFNGEAVFNTPELQFGLAFARDVLAPNEIEAYATELTVYGEREDLAGALDFVGRKSDGTFVIVDWKRAAKLADKVHCPYRKKLSAPFSHLDDTDVPKYTVQLSSYAYLLENYCGMKISALILCNVSPDQEKPFHTFVPYLKTETELLMRQRRELVARRVAAQALGVVEADSLCNISGSMPFDAARVQVATSVDIERPVPRTVHLVAGDPISYRYALAYGVETENNINASETIAESLRDIVVVSESNEAAALRSCPTEWKKIVPKDGVRGWCSIDSFAALDPSADFEF